MRKTISILIVMILLIITGCSKKEVINHNYTYKGENELWSAEYKVNGKAIFTEKNGKREYENNSEEIFVITYKEDLSKLSSIKHIEISYKSSAGGGKITRDFNDSPPDEKTYTLKTRSKNGAIENKDEIIEVTINLDGKIQKIELKNAN